MSVSLALTQYFEENSTTSISPSILWEAHKAKIRGVLIELGARRKKERGLQKEQLLSEIKTMETKHKMSLQVQHQEALESKREELRSLLNLDIKRQAQKVARTVYEWGDKP